MAKRGVMVEVAGLATGFVSHAVANVGNAASWASTFEEVVAAVPSSQGMGVDPFSGGFDSQGTTITFTKLSDFLVERSTAITTALLDADLSASGTTITVDSTSGFDASGYVWLGSECIYYAAKTATTFYSCTRGVRGTKAKKHDKFYDGRLADTRKVYAANPYLVGRKCVIRWYDLDDPSSTTLRFTGYLDNPRFTESGFSLDVINAKKLIEDAEIMGGRFARGRLVGGFLPRDTKSDYENYHSDKHNRVLVEVDDPDFPFPSISGVNSRHFQVDEEIVGYSTATNPALSGTVAASGTGTFGPYFETDAPFAVGDLITWTNGGTTYQAAITYQGTGVSATYQFSINGATAPAVSDTVSSASKQQLGPVLFPGQMRTSKATHSAGAECKEVRILRGDHIELVLQLLTSTGDGANGSWDTLPEGWGAAIDVSLIDTAALESLRDYSDVREMLFDGPYNLTDLLTTLARITGSRIFFSSAGILTARAERDIYPDTVAILTLTVDDFVWGQMPQWSAPQTSVYNSWTMRGNSPRGSDFADVFMVQSPESVDRYGTRALPDLDDGGLLISQNAAKLELIGRAVVERFASPCIRLDFDVVFTDTFSLEPGQIVAITIDHLPDLRGGGGLSDTLFEVLEVYPNDANGTISMSCLQMPVSANTRLIAPAAEVSSVASNVLTMKAASATHLALTSGGPSVPPLSANAQDGDEDVHYFEVGTTVRIIDVSTLGGTPNEHTTTITAIDYATREITLDSVPGGWTIAAGDIVTYDTYATTEAADPALTDTYLYLGDGSPVRLDGDDPHVWGL